MTSSNGLSSRSVNASTGLVRPPLKYGDPLLDRFFNSSIGFDEMFCRIFDGVPSKLESYPPYNLFNYDSGYVLEMAVAGFSRKDISIYLENGHLIIEGQQPQSSPEERSSNAKSIIHQGLARRNFKQVLKISSLIEVQEARLEDGMLMIRLAEIKPDPPEKEYIDIQ